MDLRAPEATFLDKILDNCDCINTSVGDIVKAFSSDGSQGDDTKFCLFYVNKSCLRYIKLVLAVLHGKTRQQYFVGRNVCVYVCRNVGDVRQSVDSLKKPHIISLRLFADGESQIVQSSSIQLVLTMELLVSNSTCLLSSFETGQSASLSTVRQNLDSQIKSSCILVTAFLKVKPCKVHMISTVLPRD